ncbi:MAG: hypothetical protein ACQKBT_04820 [Puniceicoccales bacterium]
MAGVMTDRASEGLPYTDRKPEGAADFYFAINATFRFLIEEQPAGVWEEYLEQLGREYFEPVNERWKEQGISAVADYWRAFFSAEPESVVEVLEGQDHVEIVVKECPAIHHFRAEGRAPVERFCEHCDVLGQTRAREAGMAMRLEGGNGCCHHHYFKNPQEAPPPVAGAIRKATL